MTTHQEAPWWKGAVIYQIYPRSYLDTNQDGIGDLPGITARLDHVASLGVDAIWLSPFFTSPMHDFGYDVANYQDVDPIFGTLADFDRLIARAHDLGLKVIIDQVMSHTSIEHPWFQESRTDRDNPKADWYVWADAKPDGSPPNNWQSVFHGPSWTWDARRRQYYLHNFLPEQPDLNLHHPEVQEALLVASRFWLERGVDGFRLDAINFGMHDTALRDNPPATHSGPRTRPFDFQDQIHTMCHPDMPGFLERVRRLTDEYGAIFTVAEIAAPDPVPVMKAYTQPGHRLNSAYNFTFLYARQITGPLVRRALEAWGEEDGWPAWAFSNHDAPRAVSRWTDGDDTTADADPGFAKLLLALLMCLRGNVFLYQGEELGLPQARVPRERLVDPEAIANWPLTLGRDGARTPMPWSADEPHAGFSPAEPWLPMDPRHGPLAVDQQNGNTGSVLEFVRRLTALRRDHQALRHGEIIFREVTDTMVTFERGTGADRLFCAFNLASDPVRLEQPGVGFTQALLPNQDLHWPHTLPGHGYLIAAQTGEP